jgi:tRNA threonylcarbamoyladenosine biosynthesis protein TsaB
MKWVASSGIGHGSRRFESRSRPVSWMARPMHRGLLRAGFQCPRNGMFSLSEIVASHKCLLILDAASSVVQVGLACPGGTMHWSSSRAAANSGLFQCVATVLADNGVKLETVSAFAYCDGPGSILGIRTAAMAIRTWNALLPRPAYAYNALILAGCREKRRPDFREQALIADARRDAWHCLRLAPGRSGDLVQRVPTAELPDIRLVSPANFRQWTKVGRPIDTCSYDLSQIVPEIIDERLFRLTDAPDAFEFSEPSYKRWSPGVHTTANRNST